MADDRKRREKSMSEAEMLDLQALADKRNQAHETVSDAVRKLQQAQQSLIDKMR